jgi:hypothetical protein
MVLPSTVLFVASDLGVTPDQLSFSESDSCPAFDEWLRVRKSGIDVDFRQILRFDSYLPELKSRLLNDSIVDEIGMNVESAGIVNGMHRRFEDCSKIVIKSILFTDLIEDRLIDHKIENLINLCHPCISAPIGFVFAAGSGELKVVQFHSESPTLKEIISANPLWWTPTVKAKAVAGVVLALRFWHSLGLIHGCLTTNSIVFDWNHHIQITDVFCELSALDVCGFSREGWTPKMDIRGFVSVLFEIIVGRPPNDETDIPADVPIFVYDLIKAGLSSEMGRRFSFLNVFETLKLHDFKIIAGVDSAEVLSFVDWIEQLEQSRE